MKREGVSGAVAQHEEGMSTDDEQNLSELAHFKSEKGQVRYATIVRLRHAPSPLLYIPLLQITLVVYYISLNS